ncbi:MAG: hypothetical protein OXR66_01190 [Candidatus Woesearchaeota archaeon]|nr:hypothetical protein [Candidatus Woesearchaeota archaeon]
MDQQTMTSLDTLIEALHDLVDDPHFEEHTQRFGAREAWNLVRGRNLLDNRTIYDNLKAINRSTPNKIKGLVAAVDGMHALKGLRDFRSRSLGYKLLTAPLYLPKKAAVWAENQFSTEQAADHGRYATLIPEALALGYLGHQVHPAVGIAAVGWCAASESVDRLLDVQQWSQVMFSLWPAQIQGAQGRLLKACGRKRVGIKNLMETAIEYADDLQRSTVRANDFDELLELNPNFGEFLDTLHTEGYRYPHLAATAAGLLWTHKLPETNRIAKGMLQFYHQSKPTGDITERYIHDHETADHLVGHLLRGIRTQLIDHAARVSAAKVTYEIEGLEPLGDFQPHMQLGTVEMGRESRRALQCSIDVPLRQIAGDVPVQLLMSRLEESIADYVKEHVLTPHQRITDYPDFLAASELDLSSIQDIGIDPYSLVKIGSETTLNGERLRITYTVSPELKHDYLSRATMQIEMGHSPFEAVGGSGSASRDVYAVHQWSLPRAEDDEIGRGIEKRKQERIAAGEATPDDIREQMQWLSRDAFEAMMSDHYDAQVAKLREEIEREPTNNALFMLGLLEIVRDRAAGTARINQAIDNGYLEQPQPGILGGKANNRNPLVHHERSIRL